jgi:predicted DNA-binding protein
MASSTVLHYYRRMARADKQINIRLPDGMRDRISALAKANGRSMNAEIVACLEKCLEKKEALSQASKKDAYTELLDMMEELGRLASTMPPKLLELAVNSGRVKVVENKDGGD